jgi:hypothetical protein
VKRNPTSMRSFLLRALLAGLLAGSAEGWPADLLTAMPITVRNYTSSQCTPLDHLDADLEPECLDVQGSSSGSNTFTPNSTCGGIALFKGRCVVSQQGAFSDISLEEVEPVLATRLQRSEASTSMPWCTSFSQAADGAFVGSGIIERRVVTLNGHKDHHPYVHTRQHNTPQFIPSNDTMFWQLTHAFLHMQRARGPGLRVGHRVVQAAAPHPHGASGGVSQQATAAHG